MSVSSVFATAESSRQKNVTAWDRDPARLELASVNALVIDPRSGEVLYSRNPDQVVPIASVTKLMTAMVVIDAKQDMGELIPIQIKQVKELKNVYSRVRVGSQLKREEVLLLALMSSENRAAASLAHNYPGGVEAFVKKMNEKARQLGMVRSRFVEPTGLSENNVSTASDLAKMLVAAGKYSKISDLSTTAKKDTRFRKPGYSLAFYNTNPLVRNDGWDIKVSKTGFINEAGHCLVLLADIKDRPVAMVLLDSFGKRSHVGDATRIRRWIETGNSGKVPSAAKAYERRKNPAS